MYPPDYYSPPLPFLHNILMDELMSERWFYIAFVAIMLLMYCFYRNQFIFEMTTINILSNFYDLLIHNRILFVKNHG